MILEYTVQSALAQMRATSSSSSSSSVALSQGLEDHASFATLAAAETTEALRAFRVVVAGELVAVVRGLRMKGTRSFSSEVRRVFDDALEVLDEEVEDRRLDLDLVRAGQFLEKLFLRRSTRSLSNEQRAYQR